MGPLEFIAYTEDSSDVVLCVSVCVGFLVFFFVCICMSMGHVPDTNKYYYYTTPCPEKNGTTSILGITLANRNI